MRKFIVILALLVTVLLVAALGTNHDSKQERDVVYSPLTDMSLIAHAGGGLPQGNYSNAREAFDLSAKNGFTVIETDFNWTEDGSLVLIRDWDKRRNKYFGKLTWMPPALTKYFPRRAATSAAFMEWEMNSGLHQMDLDALLSWMKDHQDVRIVTDVKTDNIGALAYIKHYAGDLQNRFIVQIYAPEEYGPAKALGYEDIIFTAYRSALNDAALVKFATNHSLYALTVPVRRAKASLCQSMKDINTPIYTHTINTKQDAEYFKKLGFDGLYTDYLFPGN